MRRIFTSFIVVILLGGSLGLSAQDIHFSQFYMSPLNLNPAMTGVMNCTQRAVVNYRNQWASVISNPFNTFSASYDFKQPVGRSDYWGGGVSMWGDVAGSANFKTLQARISGSYSKYMDGSRSTAHYLVVGADLAISQRSIDFAKLQWGTQHDGNGGHDPLAPDGENFSRDNFFFGDISVGLLWFSTLSEKNSFYIGGAAHHVNRPNQSFFDDQNVELYNKYTLHAGGEIEASNKVSIIPGLVTFFQGPSFQLNGGSSVRFHLGNSRSSTESFQIGAWARLVNNYEWGFQLQDPEPPIITEDTKLGIDAVIISSRFDFDQFGIGFSYDVNVSDLQPASNSNGAFEFSLIYNVCGRERRALYCPNF